MSTSSCIGAYEQHSSGIRLVLVLGLGISLPGELDVIVLLVSHGFELLLGDLAGVQASQDRLL